MPSMMASESTIASTGTSNARFLSGILLAPYSATADIAVKFGGCGIRRESAPRKTKMDSMSFEFAVKILQIYKVFPMHAQPAQLSASVCSITLSISG
jgi:hypothetical protein